MIAAGLFACVQMGLLGAVLTFSAHPWFAWYVSTTEPWGLTQLQDQQLGGVIMWVPSGVVFLAAMTRSMMLMHHLARAAGNPLMHPLGYLRGSGSQTSSVLPLMWFMLIVSIVVCAIITGLVLGQS